jgi:hypothetical protein
MTSLFSRTLESWDFYRGIIPFYGHNIDDFPIETSMAGPLISIKHRSALLMTPSGSAKSHGKSP